MKFRKKVNTAKEVTGKNTKLPHKFFKIKEKGIGMSKIREIEGLFDFHLGIKKLDVQKDDWQ